MNIVRVPFFRTKVTGREVTDVAKSLRSGWLTTGPRVREFELRFSEYVGVRHAVTLNSCTAALHLALEAVGIGRGDQVLVPTMTFAATAEVVRYFDAVPVFVDCDPVTLCMDAGHLERQAKRHRCKAVIPMHYGGQMCDMFAIKELARRHRLRIIEDAAHTLPAFMRAGPRGAWKGPGELSDVACFSFYANKCITTGEGGMAVTNSMRLADRMRLMSLHGMNRDPWKRFTAQGSWYYEIVAPGFKYNMTDIAAALGVEQLKKAGVFWKRRQEIAARFLAGLRGVEEVELPVELPDRKHSWHLFAVKLKVERLKIDRAAFIRELKDRGIVCSVHWKPLHMMPYYVRKYGYRASGFPVAASLWPRLVSLPMFPAMKASEIEYVVDSVSEVARKFRR
ncbi:MAG: DegT/DnrJ/EryC1/StrS family aminotransferase [Deltaproteobacteria bacterium]|nr:DegT/DnrJ/EryC1/StrS family aminotransferase [Deltaproteobacteria bacterium]